MQTDRQDDILDKELEDDFVSGTYEYLHIGNMELRRENEDGNIHSWFILLGNDSSVVRETIELDDELSVGLELKYKRSHDEYIVSAREEMLSDERQFRDAEVKGRYEQELAQAQARLKILNDALEGIKKYNDLYCRDYCEV